MNKFKNNNKILKKFLFQKLNRKISSKKTHKKENSFNSFQTIKFKRKIKFFDKEILNKINNKIKINQNSFNNSCNNRLNIMSKNDQYYVINNKINNNKYTRLILFLDKFKNKYNVSFWGIYEGNNKNYLNYFQKEFHKIIINTIDFDNIKEEDDIYKNLEKIKFNEILFKKNLIDVKINWLLIINDKIINIFNKNCKFIIFDKNKLFSTLYTNSYILKEFINIKYYKMNKNDKYIILSNSFGENFFQNKKLINIIKNLKDIKTEVNNSFKSFLKFFNFSFIIIKTNK